MMTRYFLKPLIMLALCAALAGCGGASGPAPKRYGFDNQAIADSVKGKKSRTVRLTLPSSSPTLDGRSIQVQRATGELTVVDNAVWADPLPYLVAQSMAETLRAKGMTVVEAGQAGRTSLQINTSIERFTLAYDESGVATAQVSLNFTVLSLPDKRPIANVHYEDEKPVSPVRMTVVTGAFQDALAEAFSKLIRKL